MTTLAIKTAAELKTLDSLERQAARRAARETPLVRQLWIGKRGDDRCKVADSL